MTILFADGYEVGTTLAEANTMSGNIMTANANITGASTLTFSAASSGLGRSFKPTIISAGAGNTGIIGTPVTGFQGASGAVGYKFSFGFRAKINTSKTSNAAVTALSGLGNAGATSSLLYVSSNAAQTSSSTLAITFGTANVGSFTVPDVNLHYYSFAATKTATNVWSLTVTLDNNTVFSGTGLTAVMIDAIFYFPHIGNGEAAATQVNVFSEIDDVYISNTSPFGPVFIRRISPSSDVQAQWTRVGGGSTNFGSIDNISLTSGLSVTSGVTATDIYGNTSTITAGKKVVAIRGSAICTGTSGDTVTENINVNGTPINSTATALAGTDTLITTGWNTTVAVPVINQVQFGMTKN